MSKAKLDEYQEWLAKVEDAGVNLLAFNSPCCGNSLKTFAPETKGAMWDSFAVCPYCSEPYWKQAYYNRVEVKAVNHSSTHLKTAKGDLCLTPSS